MVKQNKNNIILYNVEIKEFETNDEYFWIEQYLEKEDRKRKEREEKAKQKRGPVFSTGMEYIFKYKVLTLYSFLFDHNKSSSFID